MSLLEPHPEGVVLTVRAQPGGRTNSVTGVQDGALRVSVTQVAEKGKANKALVAVLAKHLGIAKSQIELLAGETNRNKRFLIRNATINQLEPKLPRPKQEDL